MPRPGAGERLWRVRKHHVWIDAQLRPAPEGGVSLRFFYDGHLVFARRCPSRERAIEDAGARLRELERAGWNTHW